MDKRVLRTRKKIKEGVLEIYEKESLDTFPIAFLCKSIGLNRTTFYIHYSCIDDVIKEMGNDMVADIKKIVAGHLEDLPYISKHLIEYFYTNQKLVKLILHESKMKWVSGLVIDFKNALLETSFINQIQDKGRREYAALFIIHGTCGILGKWILDECSEAKPAIVKKVLKFIRTGEQLVKY